MAAAACSSAPCADQRPCRLCLDRPGAGDRRHARRDHGGRLPFAVFDGAACCATLQSSGSPLRSAAPSSRSTRAHRHQPDRKLAGGLAGLSCDRPHLPLNTRSTSCGSSSRFVPLYGVWMLVFLPSDPAGIGKPHGSRYPHRRRDLVLQRAHRRVRSVTARDRPARHSPRVLLDVEIFRHGAAATVAYAWSVWRHRLARTAIAIGVSALAASPIARAMRLPPPPVTLRWSRPRTRSPDAPAERQVRHRARHDPEFLDRVWTRTVGILPCSTAQRSHRLHRARVVDALVPPALSLSRGGSSPMMSCCICSRGNGWPAPRLRLCTTC